MENNPMLASLVEEALAKGLPMPLNWVVDEDCDSYSYDDVDYEGSIQAEDDPEEKEVRDDCDSQTTEDCHGGNEATRSINDSVSVAENGQEDRDSDQTNNGGDEGEDGQSSGTTHSTDNDKNSGENGSGSREGGDQGTCADISGGQGDSGN